jgi:hypothetical protein
MTMQSHPFETLEGQGFPTVRQLSVFVDNRVGQLLKLTQILDHKDVRLIALSVMDSVDCAIVRLLVDRPDEALELLAGAGFATSVTEVVVVRLPPGRRGLLTVLSSLLSSEINVAYVYPLLSADSGSGVALLPDNLEIAVDTLQQHHFEVLGEADLGGRR